MFLLNSRQEIFRCGPSTRRYWGGPYPEVTAAILPSSLRTSHSFALVFSTLPPVSVCGTVPLRLTQTKFFSEACSPHLIGRSLTFRLYSRYCCPDLPKQHAHSSSTNPIRCCGYNAPSLHRNVAVCRNINLLSIGSPIRDPLRTD